MTREEYREVYLRSPHWQDVRQQALGRAGYRCQVCNGERQLDVHHRTYERIGFEQPGDLTVLCRGCHDLFHGERPAKKNKPKRPKRTCAFCRGKNGRHEQTCRREAGEAWWAIGLARMQEAEQR